ncbi:MAG: RNA polymerase sigma-70 factor (ECF subfamily) [Crocinitomix sp.]
MLTKEQLNKTILKVQSGNHAAFEVLYDAYAPAMYGVSLKILRDERVAEDSVQDAFVKIWKKIHSFDVKKGSFFTWILNINRNTAIDKYRKLSKSTLIPIQSNENLVHKKSSKEINQKIDHIGIKDLVKVLPEKEQIILEYIYFKGYTQQETADELGLPLGTVKTRSRSALKGLKELFGILLVWI